MPKYQAKSSSASYPVSEEDLAALDLHENADGSFHLLNHGSAHRIDVLHLDRQNKRVTLSLDGAELSYRLLDKTDQQIDALGFSSVANVVSKNVYAPMPGLVLQISVAVGDEVTAGTPLIILEAMKMENVLKAEGDGTVTAIEVSKGQAVDKKQLLISVE